jgi:hypothetical protein
VDHVGLLRGALVLTAGLGWCGAANPAPAVAHVLAGHLTSSETLDLVLPPRKPDVQTQVTETTQHGWLPKAVSVSENLDSWIINGARNFSVFTDVSQAHRCTQNFSLTLHHSKRFKKTSPFGGGSFACSVELANALSRDIHGPSFGSSFPGRGQISLRSRHFPTHFQRHFTARWPQAASPVTANAALPAGLSHPPGGVTRSISWGRQLLGAYG